MKRSGKRGPDSCIDAVGCEASGHGAADAVLDKVKAATFLATDRVHVVRQAIMCCRKAGTVSIPGVYVGIGDKIPLGAAMNKGLTIAGSIMFFFFSNRLPWIVAAVGRCDGRAAFPVRHAAVLTAEVFALARCDRGGV